ncbi:MAG: cellulase family glycosylhydrolase, partial [Myxococcales bacterium]|nr:cellulase family glycosylhydrolase [Myxococcales bacterium]
MHRTQRILATALVCALAAACQPNTSERRYFLTDDQGRALVLHGVNVDSDGKGNPLGTGWITEPQAHRLAEDWGMNVVRQLVFWSRIEPEKDAFDEAYLDRVAERVQWYADAGIGVILDFHQDLYTNQWNGAVGSNGAPPWAIRTNGHAYEEGITPWWLNYLQPAVQAAFDNFFDYTDPNKDLQDHYVLSVLRIVDRFKDHPGVLGYDLMNEPFGGSASYGLFEGTKLAPFYQRVINAIRAVDTDKWIFYEPQALGVNFGIPSKLGTLTDPRPGGQRLAYFPHFYQPDVHEGGPWDGDTFFIDWWERNRKYEASIQDAPLLVGEVGGSLSDPTHVDHFNAFLAAIDRIGSGWTWWDHTPGSDWSIINADLSERPQADLLVRTYPRRVAGDPVSYAFDPASKDFELVFKETGVVAPTEIYVPAARAYPGGFDVTVSDPSGAWSMSFDAAAEILTVMTDPTQAEHTIRVT